MKLKKFMHNRIFIIVLVLMFIVVVSLVSSYAWFIWSSTDNTKLTVTIGELADVTFQTSNQINTELTPVFNYYDGEKTTFSINNKNTSGASIRYIVKLNMTTIPLEFRNASVMYTLIKNGNVVVTGDLSDATDGSTIEIYSDTLLSGVVPYELYLYIDGNIENNTSMIGKILTGNITVEAFEFTGDTLVELITKKYNNSTKTEVTNNNIKYNYATSVSLMNDRLGGTTADYDSGNIRYYGANPNNYIDIGDRYVEEIGNWERLNLGISSQSECYAFAECSNLISMGAFNSEDECAAGLPIFLQQYGFSSVNEACSITMQETPILYRIIGVFKDIKLSDGTTKDLVKVIRNDSIGTFAWDSSNNSSWKDSSLQTILNDTYYNSDSVTHNYINEISSRIIEETVDLSKNGLSFEARNKIANIRWNLGILDGETDFYSDYIYKNERGSLTVENNDPTWCGKIALLYPSDYGYAANFMNCSNVLSFYNNDVCPTNNWLKKELLLLTVGKPSDTYSSVELRINRYGSFALSLFGTYSGHPVYPAFYLNSGVSVVSGDGTEISPYVVK